MPLATQPRVVSEDELTTSLSGSVGQEKARDAVRSEAIRLGLLGGSFTEEEALRVLGMIADVEGILGVTARFARSRLMARWATERLNMTFRGTSSG